VQKPVSKDEVIAAIRECARKLGRPPSFREFAGMTGITFGKMRRHFPSIGYATRAAGLRSEPHALHTETRGVLMDWARVARKVRRLPSRAQYRRYGQHSTTSIFVRFGRWALLPAHFLEFARQNGVEEQWQDVLQMIAHKHRFARAQTSPGPQGMPEAGTDTAGSGSATRSSLPPSHPLLSGRPLAGGPLSLPGLSHEPANEAGVIFLFGILAHRLRFRVISLQPAFPDCEAMRELQPGKWQRVRVEFEFESRNFKDHGHDPDLCDVIVCWRHNWAECPAQLDIVELSRVVH
jgi:Homing endonuclease associated repeat